MSKKNKKFIFIKIIPLSVVVILLLLFISYVVFKNKTNNLSTNDTIATIQISSLLNKITEPETSTKLTSSSATTETSTTKTSKPSETSMPTVTPTPSETPALTETPSQDGVVVSNIDPRSLTDYKYIALTFDDGPYSEIDLKILELLNKYNGQATFFVLGSLVVNNPETVKAIVDQGSEIGNHSFSHKNFTKLSYEQLMAEVNETNAIIKQHTGIVPTIIRPPYGAYNESVLAALPYPISLWDHDTFDWKLKDSALVGESLKKVLPGSVVLMHSNYPETLKALEETLPTLYEQGFRFVTVTDLYKIYGVQLIPHGRHSSPADELGR